MARKLSKEKRKLLSQFHKQVAVTWGISLPLVALFIYVAYFQNK